MQTSYSRANLLTESSPSPTNERSVLKAMAFTPDIIRTGVHSRSRKWESNPDKIKSTIFNDFETSYRISNVQVGTSRVNNIVLSLDERYAYLAHAGDIMTVHIHSGLVDKAFKDAHAANIEDMLLIPSRNILVSGSADKSIKLWDLSTQQLLHTINNAHEAKVSCLSLTPDETYLISGSHDSSIKVWDLTELKCIGIITNAHKEHIFAVTVTKDGSRIISAGMDKSIQVWDRNTLISLNHVKYAHIGIILSLEVSSDNNTLISTCADGQIKAWDLNKMELIHKFLDAHVNAIGNTKLIGNSRFILSVSRDCSLSVCDFEKKTHLHSFRGFGTEPLVSLAVTRNESMILITSQNGSLFIIDFGLPAQQPKIKTSHTKVIVCIKLTWDDKYLVTGADDGCIQVWDLKFQQLMHTFQKVGDAKEIWNLDISPDNGWIVSVCSDGELDLWNLSDKVHFRSYKRVNDVEATCAIFSKDGSKMIAFLRDCMICVYDALSGNLISQAKSAHTDVTFTLDMTTDNQYIVSGSADKSIEVWNFEKNESYYVLENAHDAMVWKVKLTYNNKFIVSSSSDGTIKLWDFHEKELVHTFNTSQKTDISALSITRDNTYAVSIDNDGILEILNLKTKQQAYVNKELEGELCLSLCITSDNKKIIFVRETDIYIMENPFLELTVQHSLDCNPYTLMRFMPFTTYFFKNNLQHRKNMISSYPELMIHPQGWNWLHIASIFSPNKELIQTCFDNRIPFTIDLMGKTPLHYLFENKISCIDSINLVLQKFDQILEQCQKPSALLKVLGNIFCKILALDNKHVANFLGLCTSNTDSESMTVMDIYGDLKNKQEIGFHRANSIFYSPEIKQSLISEGYTHKVSIRVLPFFWDYSPASDNMQLLVRTLKTLNYPGIFDSKIVSKLIKYLWDSSKRLYYILALLFSLQTILISVDVSVPGGNAALDIIILCLAAFFIVYEAFEIFHNRKDYFSSAWNYVDMFGHILVLVTFIAVRAGMDGTAKDWLFSFILALIYTRWISYFRVFKQTRKLIRLIIEVTKSIWSFGMVLVFVIFGLSLIFLQFDKETHYETHLLNSYLLLYQEFDIDDLNTGETFYFTIVIAIVSIVLLNMLIAIMEDTFKEAQERSIVVESKELLELIDETINARRIMDCFRKKKDYYEEELKSYLFYAEKVIEEDDFKQEKEEKHAKYLKACLSEEIKQLQCTLNEQIKHTFDEDIVKKIESQETKIQEQNMLLLEQSKMIQEQGKLLQTLTETIAEFRFKSRPLQASGDLFMQESSFFKEKEL